MKRISKLDTRAVGTHLSEPFTDMCHIKGFCPLKVELRTFARAEGRCPVFGKACESMTEQDWNNYFRGAYDYVLETLP